MKNLRKFTLIELLIVLIILGLLASLVAPKMFGKVDQSKVKTAVLQMELLSTALDAFRLDTGSYPNQLNELRSSSAKNWQGPYLSKKLPLDPWGNAYVYRNEDPYVLMSLGKDGAPGGEELDADIFFENE
ncbi:MAG: type II secretion system major pseudopilin GspG [Lentisphaeraceae bacterium]|nr:type II secretion system major pseudopilin GspG [Lentisphaeraceae bacterium]